MDKFDWEALLDFKVERGFTNYRWRLSQALDHMIKHDKDSIQKAIVLLQEEVKRLIQIENERKSRSKVPSGTEVL